MEGLALLEEQIADERAAKEGPACSRADGDVGMRRRLAVVQNKVIRGMMRRGQSLREAFEAMDTDGSGEGGWRGGGVADRREGIVVVVGGEGRG